MVDAANRSDLTDDAPIYTHTRFTVGMSAGAGGLPSGSIVAVTGMRRSTDGPDGCFRNFRENGFMLGQDYYTMKHLAQLEETVLSTSGLNRVHCVAATPLFFLAAAFVLAKDTYAPTKVKVTQNNYQPFFEKATDGEWTVVGLSSAETISQGDYIRRYFAYLSPAGGRLEVTYYDSSGNQHAGVSVARMVLGQNSFRAAQDGSDSSLLTVYGPTYTLGGATSPVTNVTVDSNGDIVLERNPITLTKSF